jgi:hypothetical protein
VIAKDELNEAKLAKKKHKDWVKMNCWKTSLYPPKKNTEKKPKKK